MISFQIDPRYRSLKLKGPLTRAVKKALTHEDGSPDTELTLVITGDAELLKLNRQFRAITKSTDVLSFPANELDKESGRQYLGDVVISLPRARAQAKSAGHPLIAEMQLLAIHGLLHLLGHDHGSEKEREKMWRAQDEILGELSLAIRSVEAETLHSQS